MQQDLKREVEAIRESLQQLQNYPQTIGHHTCVTILLVVNQTKTEFHLEHQGLVHKDNLQTQDFTVQTTEPPYHQVTDLTNPLQTEVEYQTSVVELA